MVLASAALAGTVVLTGCGGSSGPAAESTSTTQEQNQESSDVINPATLVLLKTISVGQAEQESGVTAEQIREYVKDPTRTPYLTALKDVTDEVAVHESARPPDEAVDPFAVEAKVALDDSNSELLESLLREKRITPERLLVLYNWYQSNMEQIKTYQSQPDREYNEKDILNYTQFSQVVIARIIERVASGEIELKNKYEEKVDPRVRDLYVEYYGSEERVLERFGGSPIGQTFMPTIKDGVLDMTLAYDVEAYTLLYGELMDYETIGPYQADPFVGANIYFEQQRQWPVDVYYFLERFPAQ